MASYKYFRNLAGSIKDLAKDSLSNKIPAIAEFKEVNDSVISMANLKSMVNVKKLFRDTKNRMGDNSLIKDVKTSLKDAFKQIKSGKIYDKDKAKSSSFDDFGDEDDFGGFDINEDDEYGDDIDDEDFGDDSDSKKTKIKTPKSSYVDKRSLYKFNFNNSFDKSGHELNYNLTKAEIANDNKNTLLTISFMRRMHEENRTYLQPIMANIKVMADFTNKYSEILNSQSEFYEKSLQFQEDLVALTREHLDIYKTKEKEEDFNESQMDKSFSGTALDLKAYKKAIGKNITNLIDDYTFGMGSLLGDEMGRSMFKSSLSNPVAKMLGMGFKLAIPLSFMRLFDATAKNIGSFSKNLMRRLYSMRSEDGISGFLGRIFGLKEKKDTSVNIRDYEKGQVAFDGKTRMAIVNVIPNLLGKIYAAIKSLKTGTEEEHSIAVDYDYGGIIRSTKAIKEEVKNKTRFKEKEGSAALLQVIDNLTKTDNLKGMDRKIYEQTKEGLANAISNIFREQGLVNLEELRKRDIKSATKYVEGNISSDSKKYVNRRMLIGMINQLKSMPGGINDAAWVRLQNELNNNLGENLYNDMDVTDVDSIEAQVERLKVAKDLDMGNNLIRDNEKGSIEARIKEKMKNASNLVEKKKYKMALDIIKDQYDSKYNVIDRTKLKNKATSNRNKGGNELIDILSELDYSVTDRTSDKKDLLRARLGKDAQRFDAKQIHEMQEALLNPEDKNEDGMFSKMFSGIRNILTKPFNTLGKGFRKVDKLMYRVIFGSSDKIEGKITDEESKELKELDPKSLSEKGIGLISAPFILIREGFTKIKNVLSEKVIKPLSNILKEKLNNAFEKIKLFAIGKKNEKGLREGGILSEFLNFSSRMAGISREQLKSKFNKLYDTISTNVKNIFSKGKNFVKEKFNQMNERLFGSEKYSEFKSKLKENMPKLKLAAGIGLVGSFFLPGGMIFSTLLGSAYAFRDRLTSLKNVLFGKEKVSKFKDQFISKFKSGFSKLSGVLGKYKVGYASTGMALGMLGSMFLPVGPLMGGLIGAVSMLSSSANSLRETLFGNKPINNQTAKIKDTIHKSYRNTVSRILPDALAFAGIYKLASLSGLLPLPGGYIASILMGTAVSLAKNSSTFREALFGKIDSQGNKKGGIISAKYLNILRRNGVSLGLTGIATKLGFSTFGLYGGLVAGGLSLLATNTDTFNKFIFGTKGEKGKLGLLKRIAYNIEASVIIPFRKFFRKQFGKVGYALNRHIFIPFKRFGRALWTSTKTIFSNIGFFLMDAMNKKWITPVGDFFKKKLLSRMTSLIGKLFNSATSLFSGLAKGIGGMFNFASRRMEKFSELGARGKYASEVHENQLTNKLERANADIRHDRYLSEMTEDDLKDQSRLKFLRGKLDKDYEYRMQAREARNAYAKEYNATSSKEQKIKDKIAAFKAVNKSRHGGVSLEANKKLQSMYAELEEATKAKRDEVNKKYADILRNDNEEANIPIELRDITEEQLGVTKEINEAVTNLNKKATTPGSIYTHDIRLEKLFTKLYAKLTGSPIKEEENNNDAIDVEATSINNENNVKTKKISRRSQIKAKRKLLIEQEKIQREKLEVDKINLQNALNNIDEEEEKSRKAGVLRGKLLKLVGKGGLAAGIYTLASGSSFPVMASYIAGGMLIHNTFGIRDMLVNTLIGSKDKEGKRSGGLLKKILSTKFMKNTALLGSIYKGYSYGGLTGALVGGALTGIMLNMDKVKNYLFGDGKENKGLFSRVGDSLLGTKNEDGTRQDNGFLNSMVGRLTKSGLTGVGTYYMLTKGMATGGLTGLAGGALAAAAMYNAGRIKTFLFGDKKKKGLLGNMADYILKPLKLLGRDFKTYLWIQFKWIGKGIRSALTGALTGIKGFFSVIGKKIPQGFKDWLTKKRGGKGFKAAKKFGSLAGKFVKGMANIGGGILKLRNKMVESGRKRAEELGLTEEYDERIAKSQAIFDGEYDENSIAKQELEITSNIDKNVSMLAAQGIKNGINVNVVKDETNNEDENKDIDREPNPLNTEAFKNALSDGKIGKSAADIQAQQEASRTNDQLERIAQSTEATAEGVEGAIGDKEKKKPGLFSSILESISGIFGGAGAAAGNFLKSLANPGNLVGLAGKLGLGMWALNDLKGIKDSIGNIWSDPEKTFGVKVGETLDSAITGGLDATWKGAFTAAMFGIGMPYSLAIGTGALLLRYVAIPAIKGLVNKVKSVWDNFWHPELEENDYNNVEQQIGAEKAFQGTEGEATSPVLYGEMLHTYLKQLEANNGDRQLAGANALAITFKARNEFNDHPELKEKARKAMDLIMMNDFEGAENIMIGRVLSEAERDKTWNFLGIRKDSIKAAYKVNKENPSNIATLLKSDNKYSTSSGIETWSKAVQSFDKQREEILQELYKNNPDAERSHWWNWDKTQDEITFENTANETAAKRLGFESYEDYLNNKEKLKQQNSEKMQRERELRGRGGPRTDIPPKDSEAAKAQAAKSSPIIPIPGTGISVNSLMKWRKIKEHNYQMKFHYGIDMNARKGTPVYALHDATIGTAGGVRGYGNTVTTDNDDNTSNLFAHLSKIAVQRGQKVKAGDLIGYTGNTGGNYGPHLHFELRNRRNVRPGNKDLSLYSDPLAAYGVEKLKNLYQSSTGNTAANLNAASTGEEISGNDKDASISRNSTDSGSSGGMFGGLISNLKPGGFQEMVVNGIKSFVSSILGDNAANSFEAGANNSGGGDAGDNAINAAMTPEEIEQAKNNDITPYLNKLTFNMEKKKRLVQNVLPIALENYKKYGALPSIALGQSAVESGWGESKAATQANNIFGIKKGSTWKGPTIDLKEGAFRKYNNVGESVADYGSLMGSSLYKDMHSSGNYEEVMAKIAEKYNPAKAKEYTKQVNEIIKYNKFDVIDKMIKENNITMANKQPDIEGSINDKIKSEGSQPDEKTESQIKRLESTISEQDRIIKQLQENNNTSATSNSFAPGVGGDPENFDDSRIVKTLEGIAELLGQININTATFSNANFGNGGNITNNNLFSTGVGPSYRNNPLRTDAYKIASGLR